MKLEEAKEILNSIDVIDLKETHDVTDEIYNLAIETILQELKHLQKENEEYSKQLDLDYVDKNFVSKEKIMKYKKEAENAECKSTLQAVCIGAIIGVLDGLLEE